MDILCCPSLLLVCGFYNTERLLSVLQTIIPLPPKLHFLYGPGPDCPLGELGQFPVGWAGLRAARAGLDHAALAMVSLSLLVARALSLLCDVIVIRQGMQAYWFRN